MTPVTGASELQLWIAELDYLAACSVRSRTAQFAIRTAERACCLAAAAGTNPVDELLDARSRVASASARSVLERAIWYVRADEDLTREMTPADRRPTSGLESGG